MKVLYLTKYSRKGASSRLRSFQYFPFLVDNGISITVKPLFDDVYLENLYQGKKQSSFKILGYYISRFFVLFTVLKYDNIVIEKELFPYFFSWFEKLLNFLNVSYVVDYDDAIFHNYDLSKNKLILFLLKNKIPNVMKNSQCVIAGNDYLAQKALNSGAKNVVIIPTVIDTNNYIVKTNYDVNQVVIGWIGSPSTFKYVKNIIPVLDELVEEYNCKIHIVGVKADEAGMLKNFEFITWTESSETESIRNFDIGIMPLDATPWELGKCSYKLIQYMGCGVPVVASAVGMNVEVVEDNVNGYLANDLKEWKNHLEKLILNVLLRKELGKNGRKKVEQKYSLAINESLILSVIQS